MSIVLAAKASHSIAWSQLLWATALWQPPRKYHVAVRKEANLYHLLSALELAGVGDLVPRGAVKHFGQAHQAVRELLRFHGNRFMQETLDD